MGCSSSAAHAAVRLTGTCYAFLVPRIIDYRTNVSIEGFCVAAEPCGSSGCSTVAVNHPKLPQSLLFATYVLACKSSHF